MLLIKSYILILLYSIIISDHGDAQTTIEINPARVITGLTETLSVRCNFNKGEASNIDYPFSILLAKSNNSEQDFFTLASVYQYSGPQTRVPNNNNVKVDGIMNGTGSSFLQITYTPPTFKDCGFYKCVVKGIDESDNVVEEFKTTELIISSPSTDDIFESYQMLLGRVTVMEKEIEFLTSSNNKKDITLQKTITDLQDGLIDNANNIKVINASNQMSTARSIDYMFMNTFRYGNSTYYLSRFGIKRAHLGEIACAIYGGYQVEIDSQDEYNAIVTSFRKGLTFSGVYVGMTDLNTEGRWFNSFSRNPVTFTLWASVEPNGGSNENCVILYQPKGFQMADVLCSDNESFYWHFLCEVSNN